MVKMYLPMRILEQKRLLGFKCFHGFQKFMRNWNEQVSIIVVQSIEIYSKVFVMYIFHENFRDHNFKIEAKLHLFV